MGNGLRIKCMEKELSTIQTKKLRTRVNGKMINFRVMALSTMNKYVCLGLLMTIVIGHKLRIIGFDMKEISSRTIRKEWVLYIYQMDRNSKVTSTMTWWMARALCIALKENPSRVNG